jgi:hypothetical protein
MTRNPKAIIPPGLPPFRTSIENACPRAEMSPTATARATLESTRAVAGRHDGARNHDRIRKGIAERIHPARNTRRFWLEYVSRVAPSRKRIPAIVGASQSRFGSISVDERVRQEYRSINDQYRDCPGTADRRSSILATTDTREAMKPVIRAWRRQAIRTITNSQGTPIATPATRGVARTHAAFPIIPSPLRQSFAA